jgi:3-phosphoshikimate 1-carboxyvinyltransferase
MAKKLCMGYGKQMSDTLHPLAGQVICVDGLSASGKGTLAKALAQRYRLKYLDTGCLYRAVAWRLASLGLGAENVAKVVDAASTLQFDFKHKGNNVFGVWVGGVDVTEAIRTLEIGLLASQIAALPELRKALLDFQVQFVKEWQPKLGVVLDGRDTGKNIYPAAKLKIVLKADEHVRAARRLAEYTAAGRTVSLTDVLAEQARRDTSDLKNLPTSPDVRVLDGTSLSREQVLDAATLWIDDIFGVNGPVAVPPAVV